MRYLKTSALKFGALLCLVTFAVGCAGTKQHGRISTPAAPLSQAQKDELIRRRAHQIENDKEIAKIVKQKRKTETPAEKEARKEVEDANNRAIKNEDDEKKAIARAHVVGCPTGSVGVSSLAAERPLGFIHTELTVFNNSEIPVLIRDGENIIVANLCANGSLLLMKRIRTWDDGGATVVKYTAEGRDKSGKLGTSESSQETLNPCQGLPCTTNHKMPDWHIRLQ